MAKFELVGKITISVYTTVEADTLEEAIAKQKIERRSVEMSHTTDTKEQEEEVWVYEECMDGEVYGVRKA